MLYLQHLITHRPSAVTHHHTKQTTAKRNQLHQSHLFQRAVILVLLPNHFGIRQEEVFIAQKCQQPWHREHETRETSNQEFQSTPLTLRAEAAVNIAPHHIGSKLITEEFQNVTLNTALVSLPPQITTTHCRESQGAHCTYKSKKIRSTSSGSLPSSGNAARASKFCGIG